MRIGPFLLGYGYSETCMKIERIWKSKTTLLAEYLIHERDAKVKDTC
jgi:hypothetical protein